MKGHKGQQLLLQVPQEVRAADEAGSDALFGYRLRDQTALTRRDSGSSAGPSVGH